MEWEAVTGRARTERVEEVMQKQKKLTARQYETMSFAHGDTIPVRRDSTGRLIQGGEFIRPATWAAIRRYFRRVGREYQLTEAGVRKLRSHPDPRPEPPKYESPFKPCPTCGHMTRGKRSAPVGTPMLPKRECLECGALTDDNDYCSELCLVTANSRKRHRVLNVVVGRQ